MKAKSQFINNEYSLFIEYFKANSNEFVLEEIKQHLFYKAFKEYLFGTINQDYYNFYLRGKKVCDTQNFLYHVKNINTDENTLKQFTEHMDFFKNLYFNKSLFEKYSKISVLKFKNEYILLDGEHRAVLSELLSELQLKYNVYE